MNHLDLVQRWILDESHNATADRVGSDLAVRCDIREEQIAGMIELAGLLALPHDFIDALFAHRLALLEAAHAARRCRHG